MKKLTKTQIEILNGLLLGDGHLSIGERSINPRLRINRTIVDKPYAIWINEHFKDFVSKKSLRESAVFDKRYQKTYGRISFNTLRNKAFLEHYFKWYKNGSKQIPNKINFTPLTLSVWFADDGSFYKRKSGGFEISFATQSFTKEEVDFLLENLRRISPFFEKYGNYKGKNQYKIIGNSKAARAFLKEIDKVFPPMDRKSSVWRNQFNLNKALPACPVCNSGNFVFKNGLYYGRKRVPQAQKFKCNKCSNRWKIPLVKDNSKFLR